jgi:tetratricopeptide (TPR) repeat protein
MKPSMKKLFLAFVAGMALSALCVCAQQPSQPGSSVTPAAKRAPQAKTQPEYNDYNTAYAVSGGAAMEKAANDFAAKYPNSELRSYLYSKAMHEYQNENKPEKMLAMGEKVLALDPDNSIALVLTATVLSDSLSDSDADREQKIAETRKNATHALQTIDSSFTPPANANPEQVSAYKSTLRSMAHSALGILNLKIGDNAAAENELKAAAELNKVQPDPYIWYHLALAQDHQTKYPEALASVNEALRHTGSNPELDKLAHGERDRLMKLTGASQNQPNNSQPPR